MRNPNPATLKYTAFLLDVAERQVSICAQDDNACCNHCTPSSVRDPLALFYHIVMLIAKQLLSFNARKLEGAASSLIESGTHDGSQLGLRT